MSTIPAHEFRVPRRGRMTVGQFSLPIDSASRPAVVIRDGAVVVLVDQAATRRDRGHADALSHYVVEAVRLTVTEVAERLPEFTSDDVHEALPDTTAASLALWPNAMGACFRAAALAHEIVDTGRVVRSRRDGARKRKVGVWRKEIALHVV